MCTPSRSPLIKKTPCTARTVRTSRVHNAAVKYHPIFEEALVQSFLKSDQKLKHKPEQTQNKCGHKNLGGLVLVLWLMVVHSPTKVV